MTGQSKDFNERDEAPGDAGDKPDKSLADRVGPTTRELLHLLRAIEAKA